VPPVVIPPIVVQPVVVVPIVPPSVIVKPVIVPPEIVLPIVIPPFVIPPVVVPPHEGEGDGEGEGETPEIGTPETEAQSLLMLNELRTEFAALGKRAQYIEFKATAAGEFERIKPSHNV